MEATITILGLGNILMMDEGIGVHAAKAIGERCVVPSSVEIVDGGTSGLDLLPYILGREKVLILDTVDFGRQPGFIGMVENDDIPAMLQSKVSLHHMSLSDVLSAAKLLGKAPREICLIGIQPKTIDVGLDMTGEMCDNMKTLIGHAVKKLRDWNVQCVLQSPQKSSDP